MGIETVLIFLMVIIGIGCFALITGAYFNITRTKRLETEAKVLELRARAGSSRKPNIFKNYQEAYSYLQETIAVIYKQIIDRETNMSRGTYITNIIDFTTEMAQEVLEAIPENAREGFLEYYSETHFTNTISRTCRAYVLESIKEKVLLLTPRMEKNKEDE